MIYVGVDPGLSGAIAVIREDDGLLIWDMPTVRAKRGRRNIREIDEEKLAEYTDSFHSQEVKVVIEKVASMTGQGVASTFAFGMGFGQIRMAFSAFQIKYELVTPTVWKRRMGVGANKESSLLKCIEIWGEVERPHWFGPNMGIMDGRCEAALLAEYARLTSA